MRVLAIRGKNLASLGEAFEVDLERPPLSDVGLFAITGPTGSGKSTILDALCLALFDQMPRLPGGHGVLVGRAEEEDAQRLRTTDVRSILRRGAGDGFAEVDFLGNDGRRYRARWEVWRARGRADGRMQAQTLSLTDLDTGTTIAQNKTEVLEEISRRIGLTFDQFRRSVLLAQGDFATFLKADADERSSLLERITGTEIYSELSKAAYDRAEKETAALSQLRARAQDVVPLAEAEREALEQQRGALEAEQRAATAQREAVQSVIAWYDRHDGLVEAEQKAQQELRAAEDTWDQAEGRRQQLAVAIQAQPLRPLLVAVTEAVAAATSARTENELAVSALNAAQMAATTASEQCQAAADQLVTARRQRAERRDELVKARGLDSRIEHAAGQFSAAQAKRGAADAGLTESRTRVSELTGRHEVARREQGEAEAWLAENQAFAELTGQWPRWDEMLRRYGTRQRERDTVEGDLTRGNAEIEELGQQLSQLGATAQSEATRLAADGQALKTLEEELSKTPREALRTQRQSLDRHAGLVRTAQALAREGATAARDAAEALTAREAAQAKEAAASQALAAAEEALPRLDGALQEANHAHRLAIASASEGAERLRASLRSGEPCPVCGATEHPYAGLTAVLDAQVEECRKRIASLDTEKSHVLGRRAEARSQLEGAKADLAQAEADRATASQTLERLNADWAECVFAEKPDCGLTDSQLPELLAKLLAVAMTRQQTIADQEAAADALANQVSEARTALDRLRASHADTQTTLQDLQATLTRKRAEIEGLRSKYQDIAAELETLATSLTLPLRPLEDWRSQLEESPEALYERCETWVKLWARHTEEKAAAKQAVVDLERDLAEAGADLRQAEKAQQDLANEEALQRRELAILTAERQGLLEGRAVDLVEQELEQAVTSAEQADSSAKHALLQAHTTLAGAQEKVAQAAKDLVAREAAQAQAEQGLASELGRVGIPRADLEGLLARDKAWIAAEEAFVAELQTAISHWRSVLGERSEQRQQHEANQPELERAAAEEALTAATGRLERLGQSLADTMAILRADDTRREQAAGLANAIAQQERHTALWEAMNGLIGSASGKKFRVFAQSLTLEALLAYANEHLQDLARRYRLQRVPRSDLELQVVDRDMGDEVRSVYSLSGGESFLVSLALALGLASLSSHSTQVESLFIDEGFGTLDQETLDIAIASLDTLQALGRKVGVISHVTTLVERIGTQIKVSPRSGGRSVVEVLAA